MRLARSHLQALGLVRVTSGARGENVAARGQVHLISAQLVALRFIGAPIDHGASAGVRVNCTVPIAAASTASAPSSATVRPATNWRCIRLGRN